MTNTNLEIIKKRTRLTKLGCWNWQGWITKLGYGHISFHGTTHLVHRVTFELFYKKKPKELDHICKNRKCCNPKHLQEVDHYTNLMRGNGQAAINYRKTHCLRGHEFNIKNTIITKKSNQRQCKSCNKIRYLKHTKNTK